MDTQPLVSCIMPTYNRRRFVPRAIEYFLRQTYRNRELIVVDDGTDAIGNLLPDDARIRYVRLAGTRTLGAKRNECVAACRGDLIMHWDDDDWMAPHRIECQVEALLQARGEVCGTRRMLFYELASGATWLYDYPSGARPMLIGGSLLYTKEFWRRSPFPNCQVGSDTRFIWNQKLGNAVCIPEYAFYVAMIHAGNTSPKVCRGSYWKPWRDGIEGILGSDTPFYLSFRTSPVHLGSRKNPSSAEGLRKSVPPMQPVAVNGRCSENPMEAPQYSVLMVTHNALEMVRLSTCRTLRYCAGQHAELIVVDNASKDGTVQWLRLLAARGDIRLIENSENIGHGPGLELARKQSSAPYLVTLDSDAFPLSETWLTRLRARLIEPVKATGILHHRDYIHPSCLMVNRNTLDVLQVTLLGEKDKPSRFDVAERLSHEIKRQGWRLSGLQRTGALQRGSLSEPVYLGSEYEGIVYHQWYTSRAATAGGVQVDDVPQQAIDASLQTLFERHETDPREVTVVIGARARPNEPERLRNLKAVLHALNLQDLARWRYRIVVVEQDDAPRIQNEVAPFVDRYLFAYNPGPYNRGWAFNIGAMLPASHAGALCLLDADLLVPPDFLSRCLGVMQAGTRSLLPYREVFYLDKRSTDAAIQQRQAHPLSADLGSGYTGRRFTTSQGGCIWVDASLYHAIGGHDEQFRGWGAEDREFWDRLERTETIQQLPGQLFHLHHQRPAMDDRWARVNQRRYQDVSCARLTTLTEPIGRLDRYRQERPAMPAVTEQPVRGWRQWEHWNQWDLQRIHNIVRDEACRPLGDSVRRRLASVLVRFGRSVLDIGCGPGAMSTHLMPHHHRVSWMGVDVTAKMLAVARQQHPHAPLIRGDVGMLPFRDKSQDVVLLRHVLEHLPAWLMQNALTEAIRVARRAVVVDFYVPPLETGKSRTISVGEGFLETQWAVEDLIGPIIGTGWGVYQRFPISGRLDEKDIVWVLAPPELAHEWNNPRVSIVMPTYRRPHTIFRTVDSVLAQTYSNWELIIVDNAGDAQYYFDDSRIRLYHDAGMTSASYARNQGVRHATGDLICFFDDDDDMFPTYLERFVRIFRENPSANMVRCGMVVTGGKVNFSYATPECCVRQPFVTATWTNSGSAQDQQYFSKMIGANGWSMGKGDIMVIQEALCRANADPIGGLRRGRY